MDGRWVGIACPDRVPVGHGLGGCAMDGCRVKVRGIPPVSISEHERVPIRAASSFHCGSVAAFAGPRDRVVTIEPHSGVGSFF